MAMEYQVKTQVIPESIANQVKTQVGMRLSWGTGQGFRWAPESYRDQLQDRFIALGENSGRSNVLGRDSSVPRSGLEFQVDFNVTKNGTGCQVETQTGEKLVWDIREGIK